jgi:hypothetical protein
MRFMGDAIVTNVQELHERCAQRRENDCPKSAIALFGLGGHALTMSVLEGKADGPVARPDFRIRTQLRHQADRV